jgi:hypothetical protein
MTVGFSQSFKPCNALPRKRFAAAVLRVGEREQSMVFPALSTAR